MSTGNLESARVSIPQEGDMREDEHLKDGKGRYPGVFLDEKTSPSPHTLIRETAVCCSSPWLNFFGNYYIRVTLLLNYIFQLLLKKTKVLKFVPILNGASGEFYL